MTLRSRPPRRYVERCQAGGRQRRGSYSVPRSVPANQGLRAHHDRISPSWIARDADDYVVVEIDYAHVVRQPKPNSIYPPRSSPHLTASMDQFTDVLVHATGDIAREYFLPPI